MLRLVEMLEKILLALISKLNIVLIMLFLVIFGVMNKQEVFEWIAAIGAMANKVLP